MVTKSHRSSLGPKRSSCELICQFIRQRNSHWVTRPSVIADIFFFFSNPLSFYAPLLALLSGGHVYLLDPVPRLYRQRSLRRRPSGTSGEHFWVVTWEESSLSEGVRSWTRFTRSPRFFRRSKCLEIEKDPFLGVTEKAAPFSPTRGNQGAKAVYIMSGIVNTRAFGSSRIEFFIPHSSEKFRERFYWFMRCRICTNDQSYFRTFFFFYLSIRIVIYPFFKLDLTETRKRPVIYWIIQ